MIGGSFRSLLCAISPGMAHATASARKRVLTLFSLAPLWYNNLMFLVGLISWWYGEGWVSQWRRIGRRFMGTLNFFSIGQLLETLFSPFRQISANTASDGSFGGAVRAFFDQLISRIIGSIVRLITIMAGTVVIVFQAIYETVIMLVWWVVPVLPIVGLVMFAIGWVPSWV